MQSQSTDLEKSLLSQLECPVCMEYMVPPIGMCLNGYNICNICRPKVQHCPTCRCPFLFTRNLALETLAMYLKYPCTYRKYGCTEVLSHDVIRQHQDGCRYRQQTCPVVKLPNGRCSWTGIYDGIKEPLKEEHSDKCYDYVEGKTRALRNISATMCLSEFIFAWNEVFYFRFQANVN
jgi:E3 ubiquitin-protein ligase SIAH1